MQVANGWPPHQYSFSAFRQMERRRVPAWSMAEVPVESVRRAIHLLHGRLEWMPDAWRDVESRGPRLLDIGVAAVYTPKDFELTAIMSDIVGLVVPGALRIGDVLASGRERNAIIGAMCARASAHSARWLCSTPFGSPVVPDVQPITAGCAGSTEAGPVVPWHPPSTLAHTTNQRSVSMALPGPTRSSHQPTDGCP